MRIVIDLSGAQGSGRRRGIGRYARSLAQGIARNRGDHEVLIAFGESPSGTSVALRDAFHGLLPPENVRMWHGVGSTAATDPANAENRQLSEALRAAWIASLSPDVVLVTSLFEGFNDSIVVDVPPSPAPLTAVVHYDLIPLLFQQSYLSRPGMAAWYDDRLKRLKRADLLLTISEASLQDLRDQLHIPSDRIVNISAAADPHFRPRAVSPEARAALENRYGLSRPFVLYTGGIDFRKNISALVRAYAGLPARLRAEHQLAVVCEVHPAEHAALLDEGRAAGLGADELILTGFVPEEDLVTLYNACTLAVFPSLFEGFGLPLLEAMQCGRAVIASDRSSLPEVVGRADALFDPMSDTSITQKLQQVLEDPALRADLERHALKQAARFDWDITSRRAIAALEEAVAKASRAGHPDTAPMVPLAMQTKTEPSTISRSIAAPTRPRLAYLSPLPPSRSGIADYSADLLPLLAQHYDIDVIAPQSNVADPWIDQNLQLRDPVWFQGNAGRYDRVLYHFGNSAFHTPMFDLLRQVPGVAVVHDFYLSGVLAESGKQNFRTRLLNSHGMGALRTLNAQDGERAAIWRYPANLDVLQQATGIIVHSHEQCRLAEAWYGPGSARDWVVIPLLRRPVAPVTMAERKALRARLGLPDDALVICSFGFLGATKLNARLLKAFLASRLARSDKAHLIFVGGGEDGDEGRTVSAGIAAAGLQQRVRITGWTDAEVFQNYLAAADIAVQLRTLSRGETSAAVLDCMGHGLATIVNANGSMAELDPEAVVLLPDRFPTETLVQALEALAEDPSRRAALGARARAILQARHAPEDCSASYVSAIEQFYNRDAAGLGGLVQKLAAKPRPEALTQALAVALGRSFPPHPRPRQLLVDVSEVAKRDIRTGIQRVVRGVLVEWLSSPPPGWIVEPVYVAKGEARFRYARRYAATLLGLGTEGILDHPAEAWQGDVFLGLDLHYDTLKSQKTQLSGWHDAGVDIRFVVYDLLPLQRPDWFAPPLPTVFLDWLRQLTEFDGVICDSRTVSEELKAWLVDAAPSLPAKFKVDWFHLGADIRNSSPTTGIPECGQALLDMLGRTAGFLMVGTVEPRKGHAQALAAFEALWARGVAAPLVIVGKRGWEVEQLAERLRSHPQSGRLLHWLEVASDEFLDRLYAAAACLLAASEGEGFGLPLIEAARHRLPILARDLPVFREVAGTHAFYFHGLAPEDLARVVDEWLALHAEGRHPSEEGLPWQSWAQSAAQLLERLGIEPR